MFSLIAFARWPLKAFELLDAVVFFTPPYQLTENKKLMQQELERYKPLVEIDDRGRVFFVHFTIKRYPNKCFSSDRILLIVQKDIF